MSATKPKMSPLGSEGEIQPNKKAASNQSIDTVSSRVSLPKPAGRKQSIGSQGSSRSSEMDLEKWDIFAADDVLEEDGEIQKEPDFEAAIVEIDPNEATGSMNDALEKAVKQSRISDREGYLFLDKFGLILQALIASQEKEVEVIEFLQIKKAIMDMLNSLIDNELQVGAIVLDEPHGDEEKLHERRSVYNTEEDEDFIAIVPIELQSGRSGSTSKEGGKDTGVSVDDMGASTLRENLLIQKNRLETQDNMKVIHMLELKQLEFEKTLLEMHYTKMIKPSDIQREMKETRKAVNDLRLEVSSLGNAVVQLQLDIHTHEKTTSELEAVVDSLDLEMLTNQMQTNSTSNKPMHLAKEADKIAHKLEQAQDVLGTLNSKWMEGMETMRDFQQKIDTRNDELNMLIRDETRMQHSITSTQHQRETFQHELETLTKRERTLLDKCTQSTEQIQNNIKLKKKLVDDLHHIHNEANRAQREYQKLERTLKLAHDAHIDAKLAYDKMRSAFDSTKPTDDLTSWEKLAKMFLREIANVKESLERKLDEAALKARAVENLQMKLNELYEDQIACGKTLQDLMRLTVRKRREREEKSEQCIKLEAHLSKVLVDKRLQQLVLSDCSRTEYELRKTKANISKLYNQVKIERTNLTNDLLSSKQKLAEQTEKIKICRNEVESYNNQLADREAELQKIHYLNLNASLAMNSSRTRALVAIQQYEYYALQRNEVAMKNRSFRNELQILKENVTVLTDNFVEYGQKAYELGVKFRKRSEEACVFAEKMKSYELIILNGTARLHLLEGEKSKLESILECVKTHNLIVLSNQPNEEVFYEKIQNLRTQFFEITQERQSLEIELNRVDVSDRVRELHHDWIEKRENPSILEKRIQILEGVLATNDIKVLERSLAIKQFEHLVEESISHANFLKNNYEEDLKSLVGMRKNISHMSNLIDGLIAETSMAMSKSEKAERDYLYLKKEVNAAQKKILLGLPPSIQIEEEWKHYVWQQTMLKRSKEAAKKRFLSEKTHLRGAQIIMERLRPKTSLPLIAKASSSHYLM